MDLLKEMSQYVVALLTPLLFMVVLTIRSLTGKARKSDENYRKLKLEILETKALMVKYCGLPLEHFIEDLKESQVALSSLPDDDIIGQILTKQVGSI